MHFQMKNTLKNNIYHTSKQTLNLYLKNELIDTIIDFLVVKKWSINYFLSPPKF